MTHTGTKEQHARRIHPLWIIYSFGKSIKEFILPFIAFLVLNLGSDSVFMNLGKIVIILYLIYKIGSVLLGWWHFKYLFTDKKLYIHEGRFVKEKRFIPLDRIQNVGQNTSFLHRLAGLTSLTINTASSGDESSVKLEVISRKEAERIQTLLSFADAARMEEVVQHEADEEGQKTAYSAPETPSRKIHYKMSLNEMFIASLTSFSLFAFISLLIAIYSKLGKLISIEGYTEQAFDFFQRHWGLSALVVFIILVLSVLFGTGKTYLQYGRFQVSSDEHQIFVQKGYFNHSEFSIFKKKVQAIKLNKGFLRRWLGIVKVELVSAGGTGEKKIETAGTLFPFIAQKRALRILPEILPAFQIESEMVKLPKSAIFVKLVRPSYVWIIATVVVLYFWPGYWYISAVLLILIVILRLLDGFHSSYVLSGPYIQMQSGSFSTELFLTSKSKIDELEVTESWLQRKFGLATVQVSTRARPIHVSSITDIPKVAAVRYYQWYAER